MVTPPLGKGNVQMAEDKVQLDIKEDQQGASSEFLPHVLPPLESPRRLGGGATLTFPLGRVQNAHGIFPENGLYSGCL